MNYARFGFNLLKSKLTGEKVPFQLNIHVTDVCNLRCKYCYIDFEHAVKDLPFDVFKKIVVEARACGTERISLEGGEPTVRRDIGDIVNLIRDLGMDCNINTNGYYLPRKIDELARASVISVSLDGPKEVHDRFRGEGSYDKAVAAVELARSRGIRVFVLSVLTRANRGSVDFMLDLADRLDFHWVPTSLFFMAGVTLDKDQAEKYKIPDEDYHALIADLVRRKAEGRRIAWSNRTLRYVRDWPSTYFQSNYFKVPQEALAKAFEPLPCQAARHFVVMQTNGDLYSCDPLLGYGKPANAVELGFREAFERTTTNGCVACNSFVCSEYHSLFTMNSEVILNLLTSYALRR